MVCCSKLLRHLPALGNKLVASRLPPLHSRFHFSPIDSLISASGAGKRLFWFPRLVPPPIAASRMGGASWGAGGERGASPRLPRLPVCLNHAPARNRWRFRPNPARNPCKSTTPPPFFPPSPLRWCVSCMVCFFCHRFT